MPVNPTSEIVGEQGLEGDGLPSNSSTRYREKVNSSAVRRFSYEPAGATFDAGSVIRTTRAGEPTLLRMSFDEIVGAFSTTDEEMDVADADRDSDAVPSSYVPFWNTNLLFMAVSYAEAIFIDAHSEDFLGIQTVGRRSSRR